MAAQSRRVRPGEEADHAQVVQAERTAAKVAAVQLKATRDAINNMNKALQGLKPPATGVAKFTEHLQSRFQSLGNSIGVSGRELAQIAGVGLTGSALVLGARVAEAAFRALAKGIAASIKAASDLIEAQTAVNEIFKASSAAVSAFAASAASIGLSMTDALDAARTFGGFFQDLGASVGGSADLATFFTKLTADIASFRNAQGGAKEVTEALTQSLAGNFRSLQKYGVVIRAAEVEEELFARGIINQTSQMSTAVKGIGNAIVILEKFRHDIGDTERTSGGLANTQRRLGAEFENLKANLGKLLIPLATLSVQTLTGIVRGFNALIEVFGKLVDFIKDNRAALEILVFILERLFPNASRLVKILRSMGQATTENTAATLAGAAAEEDRLVRLGKEQARIEALLEARRNVVQNTISLIQAQQAVTAADNAAVNAISALVHAEENLFDVRRDIDRLPLKIAQAEVALGEARIENERATFAVGDAERTLNRAREDQVTTARNYVRAQEDIAIAVRSLKRAEEDVAPAVLKAKRAREDQIDAVQNLIDVQRELADNRPIVEAQLNFEQAQLRVKEASLGTTKALQDMLDAQLALVDAQFDLERAQRRGRAGARDQLRAIVALQKAQLQQADAALAPERAALALRDAILNLAKVQEALVKALAGTDAANKLRDALRGVEDANLSVMDADRGVEDAHQAVTGASRGLEDANDKVRDGLRGVEDAAIAVRNAEFDLSRAHFATANAANALTTAQNALDDVMVESERAPQRLRDAQRALKEAHDAVKSSAIAAALAHYDLNRAIDASNGIVRDNTELIQDLALQLGDVAKNADAAALALRNFQNVQIQPDNRPEYTFPSSSTYGNRELGGPLGAGQLALVGEKGMEIFQAAGGKTVTIGADGPEFFRPRVSGQVIPNSQINQFMRSEASRSSVTTSSSTTHHRAGDINTNVYVKETDPDVIGHKISRYIARRAKR